MSAFVHIELSTDDRPKAAAFYKKLFGWKTRDMKMPGGVYTTFTTPAPGPGGGIGDKMSPQQPTAWMPYVGVKSVKASVAKARSLGAQVMVDYMAIDGMGAFGIFADPTGGTIGVWEAAKPAAAPKKKAAKKTAKKAPAKKASKKAPAKKAAKKASKKR